MRTGKELCVRVYVYFMQCRLDPYVELIKAGMIFLTFAEPLTYRQRTWIHFESTIAF